MSIRTWESWFATAPSAPGAVQERRAELRIGIPKVLSLWSTHQLWIAFFEALGVGRLVFSSDTSEERYRRFGRSRNTVDCCFPVKSMSAHYAELLFHQKKKIDVLFSPMVQSLPSFLSGHVVNSLSCPRVMAGPENIKAGFLKERDLFAERGIRYVSPLVSLSEPRVVAKQLHESLAGVLPGLTLRETAAAVDAGYAALAAFDRDLRSASRAIIATCAAAEAPCILILARPYHLDPGLGHEVEADLQAYGYPVLWSSYLPTDADIVDWLFGEDVRSGLLASPFDIADVWPSSFSANTNEILWAAKFAARLPWITCVVRLVSYECGMDQPTLTPVQEIVERSGTMFFSFRDLDATKPAGSVKIRTETIVHYLAQASGGIIAAKRARRGDGPFARG